MDHSPSPVDEKVKYADDDVRYVVEEDPQHAIVSRFGAFGPWLDKLFASVAREEVSSESLRTSEEPKKSRKYEKSIATSRPRAGERYLAISHQRFCGQRHGKRYAL